MYDQLGRVRTQYYGISELKRHITHIWAVALVSLFLQVFGGLKLIREGAAQQYVLGQKTK
ncbi:predicted protein [Sclerotinia sclerotiorum 1980 UF-70]|uniref:Uncharacterized protein n=1 Tax=Sclerotinia sclerotiorum (strain ATCC 18683 / 1980 / Ss-1) TaxID=665079 RepID=A7F7J9_SCLS1|nr:predicted protein [Sclerotinia sclerotiorum 1980 UF-70]EDN98720.1 predicted protein [Sclerotinia sclerotiorum 1980 UF-70]